MDGRAELRVLLDVPGVSGEVVARRGGISQQSVSAQACGRRRLRPEVLRAARLAALDVALESLSTLRRCLAADQGDPDGDV